ncbi:ankyrin repeat protein, partial [Diaporthe sp. PMI_573]
TPLHDAAKSGKLDEVCSLILHHQADIQATTSSGETPLHVAAENGHTAVVEALLKNGADIQSTTHGSETALHTAAKTGHYEVVETLLKHGAKVTVKDRDGLRPLESA